MFLQKLVERITGIAPEVRLYIDSSSSRQLISRKGLGKATHMDVNLLWIQKLKDVLVKAIKGTENPADLGTKALSRDKIAKYLRILGYRGDYVVEQDEEPTSKARKVRTMQMVSVGMIARIIGLLIAEGIEVVEGTKISARNMTCFPSVAIIVAVIMVVSVAIFAQAGSRRKRALSSPEGKKQKLESKKRRKEVKEEMADEEVPKNVEEDKSEEEETELLEGPPLDSKEVPLDEMQRRAQELRKIALEGKAKREENLAIAMAQSPAAREANEADKKDLEPCQPSKEDETESSSEEEKEENYEDSASSATDSSAGEADEAGKKAGKKDPEPSQPSNLPYRLIGPQNRVASPQAPKTSRLSARQSS